MEIAPTAAAPTAVASGAAQPDTRPVISSDFNTFLTMLTAQVRNQDPLNPMESTDFAVQLATFSGVEQQVKSNQLLEGLFIQLGQMGLADLTNWVGMDARVVAPSQFDGSPVTLYPNSYASADQTTLVVRDESGNEVSRMAFDQSNAPIDWAGVDDDGNPLPSGLYTFEVENYIDGDLAGITSVETYAKVSEARFANGQTVLMLPGGVEIYAADVLSLREGA